MRRAKRNRSVRRGGAKKGMEVVKAGQRERGSVFSSCFWFDFFPLTVNFLSNGSRRGAEKEQGGVSGVFSSSLLTPHSSLLTVLRRST